MSKVKEIVYMILDQLKGFSDDFTYTEDHIIYQVNNYRALLLKQRYSDIRKQIPNSNYSTKCISLHSTDTICGEDEDFYLKSVEPIPDTMMIGNTKIHPCDFFSGDISFISRERMRYAGSSRFTQNIIYGTIGPDNHLYLKSNNPQFAHLEKVQVTAVFEDITDALPQGNCDIMEMELPLETALIPVVIELIVKEFTQAQYKPEDKVNDATDNLSEINAPRYKVPQGN